MMQRQGGDRVRAPERRPAQAQVRDRERTSPREFLSEVRGELRKVAWPGRQEVINSTLVVLIAVIFMTALIFVFDYGSAKLTLFLFG
jgi:preprotein translocase subunit SecE